MTRNYLRSTGDLNAGNAVLEAVRPQAWNILITHLHLTTLEIWTFIQANLVVLGILQDTKIRIRIRFIAKYVFKHKEFVMVFWCITIDTAREN